MGPGRPAKSCCSPSRTASACSGQDFSYPERLAQNRSAEGPKAGTPDPGLHPHCTGDGRRAEQRLTCQRASAFWPCPSINADGYAPPIWPSASTGKSNAGQKSPGSSPTRLPCCDSSPPSTSKPPKTGTPVAPTSPSNPQTSTPPQSCLSNFTDKMLRGLRGIKVLEQVN